MAKLTDGKAGTIAKANVPEKGQRFIFDDHRDSPRGFGLRVTVAGGKAFILKYTFDGRQRRKTIGEWPTWSLEAARLEAGALRQKIDKGIDPIAEARRHRAEPTVSELVEQFCRQHVDTLRSAKEIRRYLETELVPELGDVKVKAVTRQDVRAMIEAKQGSAPVAARNLLAHVRKCFNWALERDLVEHNPCIGIKVAPARKRARILSDDEIRAFWHLVDDAPIHSPLPDALRMVLITGARPGEVSGMRWDEIEDDVWVIPEDRSKTADGHRVPLTALALAVIERMRAERKRLTKSRREAALYVFARGRRPITRNALSRAVLDNADALGNKHHSTWGRWKPHDLRRTVRTGLAALKIPEHIAERVIGHRPQGVIAVYDQHRYDPEKRAALEAWERRLRGIIEGKPADNVIPLKKGR